MKKAKQPGPAPATKHAKLLNRERSSATPRSATHPDPRRTPHSREERLLQTHIAATAAPKRRIPTLVRAWIERFVQTGQTDPVEAAAFVGASKPRSALTWMVKYRDLIDAEYIRFGLTRQMEVGEALVLLAGRARSSEDLKVQLQAIRTVLEVHGALSAKALPPNDRHALVGSIERLVGEIKKKAGSGANIRVRAAEVVEIAVSSESETAAEPGSAPIIDIPPISAPE